MINPNCTIFVPQESPINSLDELGNPIPNSTAFIPFRAWLHEIKESVTERNPGIDRDARLLRGHTIEQRSARLATGMSVRVDFDSGITGFLTLKDRVLGDPEMLRELAGDQEHATFVWTVLGSVLEAWYRIRKMIRRRFAD